MAMFEKQQSQLLVAVVTGRQGQDLFFLCDSITKRQFLINTGAEVSVLLSTGLDTHARQSGPPLLTANRNLLSHIELANYPYIRL